jgi:hypothetical protein
MKPAKSILKPFMQRTSALGQGEFYGGFKMISMNNDCMDFREVPERISNMSNDR